VNYCQAKAHNLVFCWGQSRSVSTQAFSNDLSRQKLVLSPQVAWKWEGL